jgi:hypothetical protein
MPRFAWLASGTANQEVLIAAIFSFLGPDGTTATANVACCR